MTARKFDLIVIGAGPGGYVAAIRAAQLGLKTAIVEREHLGGICLNWGCIPTKALLRSAEVFRHMRHAKDYGLTAGDVNYDAKAIFDRSRRVSARLNGGVGHLLKKNKVDVIWGQAHIDAPGRLSVTEPARPAGRSLHPVPKTVLGPGVYEADHIIIATGARPRVLPGLEPDGKVIWSYFEAMNPPAMPDSLLVVGSGAIGVEFASFYRALGVDVTIAEVVNRILPAEDAEIASVARKQFERDGIKIITDAKVGVIARNTDSVTTSIEISDGKVTEQNFSRMISAVGVVGNVEALGSEDLGVALAGNCIKVDDFGRTTVKGIYAIGDVAGAPMLAHKAEHEGVICVESIAGRSPHPLDKSRIPGCTYCHPQIASVGLTEEAAKKAGHTVKVGRFPFLANGKAIALGEDQGMVKTIFDSQTGQLLGAHLIGAEVTELIQGFVIAMGLETTEEDLMHCVFPHPTLSEMMHESTLDAFDRAIHI